MTKTKEKKKKLALNRQTVQKLTVDEMDGVSGGTPNFTHTDGCSTTGSACDGHVHASGSAAATVGSSWWPF